jgi:hypothetical protein
MEATRKGMLTVGAIVAVAVVGAAVGLMARAKPGPATAVLEQMPTVTVYKTPT